MVWCGTGGRRRMVMRSARAWSPPLPGRMRSQIEGNGRLRLRFGWPIVRLSRLSSNSLCSSFPLLQHIVIVAHGLRGLRVCPAQKLLKGRASTLQQRHGLLIVASLLVKPCQICQTFRCLAVLLAQVLFPNGQGTLIQRLGLLVPALLAVESEQPRKRISHLGGLRSQGLFPDAQSAPIQRFSLFLLPLPNTDLPRLAQYIGHVR